MTQITVVGGGVAGLVAAISAAERADDVLLLEATSKLGGRARSLDGPYVANLGPHALYTGGFAWVWLEQRGLLGPLVSPLATSFRFRRAERLRRMPLAVIQALLRLRAPAPAALSFREWATACAGTTAAEAAIGLISLPTYHHDPGQLSASFAQERFVRSTRKGSVRYVVGGWGTLIERLASHARSLGVRIETESRVDALPEAPVIVATKLSAARRLLDDPTVAWPGTTTALLDLGLRAGPRWPHAVLDLDHRVYLARYSAFDPTLAPDGHDLVQASAGMRPGERAEDAISRIEAILDAVMTQWTGRVAWRRQSILHDATGAIDPPGRSWRDRPAIARGDGVFLAGDAVAAPGLLSEVAFASGCTAGTSAAEHLHDRPTAPAPTHEALAAKSPGAARAARRSRARRV